MKFLVICQHALFSVSLCSLVKQYQEGLEVIESASVDNALSLVDDKNRAELIVFYMQLNDQSWNDLQQLYDKIPDIPILAIADFENTQQIRKAIYIGASGCVSSNFTWRTVTFVIKRILEGEIVSPSLDYKVEKLPELIASTITEAEASKANSKELPSIKLTPRQVDVLKLIQGGQSNKEIARTLDMAIPTVKIHCAAIYKELGVKNRTQAAIDAEKYIY